MANIEPPTQAMAMLAPVSARDLNIPKGTMGDDARRVSIRMKAASSTAAPTMGTRVHAEPQPYALVCTMPYTNAVSDSVMVTAPATSSFLPAPDPKVSGMTQRPTMSPATPTGMLMRKIQRHERRSVRMPPISTPTAPPLASEALHMPSARERSLASVNVVVTMVSVTGERMAAPTPCTARAVIMAHPFGANPHTRLATVNTRRPTRNMRRRPNRSATRPPRSRKPA